MHRKPLKSRPLSADLNTMGAPKIDYDVLEMERMSEIQQDLKSQLEQKVLGGSKGESLVRTILRAVVNGDYDRARNELDAYLVRRSDLPSFAHRVERYITHSKDLINAIRAKRHFPGLSSLSMSKQQELLDNVLAHFEELKAFLKKIEQVYHDLRLEDMRSTVIVVKTLFHTILVVLTIGFLMELTGGLFTSFNLVLDQFIDDSLRVIFSIF